MNRLISKEMASGKGRYRLLRPIGRGGMAEVFAAYSVGAGGFERPVCVKRMLPHAADDRQFRELFLREVKIAGRLCHGNLVQVFDCFEEGEQLGLVMELVDGIDLKSLVQALGEQGRRLPEALVAHVAGQILAALAYAHDHRIIHRDISPHNVLVSRAGEVKIGDFGIAKAMITLATRTGTLRGKLAYMSPEQAGARAVDHRTDLYSTGLILYELITGERFFGRDAQWRLIYQVVHAQKPSLSDASPALARLVEGLLEPEAGARLDSADAALEALPPLAEIGPAGARALGALVCELTAERGELLTPPVPDDDTAPGLDDDTEPTAGQDEDSSSIRATLPVGHLAAGADEAALTLVSVASSAPPLPQTMELSALTSSFIPEPAPVEGQRRGGWPWVQLALAFIAIALLALGAGVGVGLYLRLTEGS